MAQLAPEQRFALERLKEITNGGEDDVAVSVLRSVEWDVQKAAELIFGTVAPHSSQRTVMQTFDIDDEQTSNESGRPGRRRLTGYTFFTLSRSVFSLLSFPFHILSTVFRFILGVLRIPMPQFRFTYLNFYQPLRPRSTSRGGPERWIRELEEETGAFCIGNSRGSLTSTTSVGTEAGPSSLTSRIPSSNQMFEEGRKVLPDFSTGTYEDTLTVCQREAKIGCVILVSEEHDDDAEFKRSTLTDSTLVKMLYQNNIVVWGGDVRDQEAWSAAEKLQATAYPFVAFIALQSRRNHALSSSRSISPPVLTVLSRHQGNPSGSTSAQTLIDHLERHILPRVNPFLERIRAANRDRERDRLLREEQDRAFQQSALRDKERIEAKMAEERIEAEIRRDAEEKAKAERARQERDEEMAQHKQMQRMAWRRWSRRVLVNQPLQDANALRIAVRLPSGARVIRQFPPEATLTTLYIFVDSQLIPSELSPEHDPLDPPEGFGSGEQLLERHICSTGNEINWWGFKLVLSYPRTEILWRCAAKLSEIGTLEGGGHVVVEMLEGQHEVGSRLSEQSIVEGDDGYDTEESE